MLAITRATAWLGKKAILYVAIVLAILASAYLVPSIQRQWTQPAVDFSSAAQLEAVKRELKTERDRQQRRLSEAAAAAELKTEGELERALTAAREAKADAMEHRRSVLAKAISLANADADALLRDGQLEMEIQYRDHEIAGLSATLDWTKARDQQAKFVTDLQVRLSGAKADASKAMASCRSANQKLDEFEARWEVRATFQRYDRARHRDLQITVRDRCREATAAYRKQSATAEILKQKNKAVGAYRGSRTWADNRIEAATSDLDRKIAEKRSAAQGSWRMKLAHWTERTHLATVLKQAAIAFGLIIASPFLIRLFCFYVLAPAAMRRPAIRLPVPGRPGGMIPLADRSTTSVGVRLAAGEELLVRHGYLQTTSEAGAKGTQWLLDWRHPFTSLVTGLTFLTRIRGEGEVTTVSAVRDPFAEVTLLTLPDGASCALQPRALAAVAQPIRRRLRVTGHWRLLSLNAWLTMQLRYLVFHGPARLVLQGGRGVRVERAQGGRVLGQGQVVGFSTDLAYSVTRTETFWPYFLGREPLLKDLVAAGGGVVILEESPAAGQRPGHVRRGIEGMIDAGMKVFGM